MSDMNKYLTAIPIMSGMSNSHTRKTYLEMFRRAGAKRIFLAHGSILSFMHDRQGELNEIKENIDYFKSNGFEVGVWFGGLGHGGGKRNTYDFTCFVDLMSGETSEDSMCPLDENVRSEFARLMHDIAELSPDIIMLDDDFRMVYHGKSDIGCTCKHHMKAICDILGENVTREELAEKVFSGKPNKYRDAWLKANGDSLKDFALRMREGVDSVNPSIRLGHCACFSTWDVDGIDNIELSRAFAGNTKPFLRFIGAPYWFAGPNYAWINTLGSVIELERMQQHWCEMYAPDIEIFSEGDVCPRPRYEVPAAYLEGFDTALIAAGGMDGILKYMIDYYSAPEYETGYVDMHVKNSTLREKISAAFENGKAVGYQIFEVMHRVRDFDFTVPSTVRVPDIFFPTSIKLLSAASMPITYEKDGSPAVVFGENARHIDEYLKDSSVPLVLDTCAARILSECGMDTGFVSAKMQPAPSGEYYGGYGTQISGEGRFYKLEMKPGAQGVGTLAGSGGQMPTAYHYENSNGKRFLIYSFDASELYSDDVLMKSYIRQTQLTDSYKWLTKGNSICAVLRRAPGAHIICKRNGEKLTVGIWNFYPDKILDPVIELDREYKNITFIENSGKLDGNNVRLDSDIQAFGFAGFTVE